MAIIGRGKEAVKREVIMEENENTRREEEVQTEKKTSN